MVHLQYEFDYMYEKCFPAKGTMQEAHARWGLQQRMPGLSIRYVHAGIATIIRQHFPWNNRFYIAIKKNHVNELYKSKNERIEIQGDHIGNARVMIYSGRRAEKGGLY
jgi:hypothetical protein